MCPPFYLLCFRSSLLSIDQICLRHFPFIAVPLSPFIMTFFKRHIVIPTKFALNHIRVISVTLIVSAARPGLLENKRKIGMNFNVRNVATNAFYAKDCVTIHTNDMQQHIPTHTGAKAFEHAIRNRCFRRKVAFETSFRSRSQSSMIDILIQSCSRKVKKQCDKLCFSPFFFTL